MNNIQNDYIDELNYFAMNDEREFISMIEARIFYRTGPDLIYEDENPVSIIYRAYNQADYTSKNTYLDFFEKILEEFQQTWVKNFTDRDKLKFVYAAIIFFRNIELEQTSIDYLRTFLSSFTCSEDLFRKLVPSTEFFGVADIFSEMEIFRLELIRDEKLKSQLIIEMWNSKIEGKPATVEKNSSLLKIMAEHSSYLLKIKKLYQFFLQSACLNQRKRKKIIEETFLFVAKKLNYFEKKHLLNQLLEMIKNFFSQKIPNDNKIMEIRKFISFMELILNNHINELKEVQLNLDDQVRFHTNYLKEKEKVNKIKKSNELKKMIEFYSDYNESKANSEIGGTE